MCVFIRILHFRKLDVLMVIFHRRVPITGPKSFQEVGITGPRSLLGGRYTRRLGISWGRYPTGMLSCFSKKFALTETFKVGWCVPLILNLRPVYN